LYAFLFSPIHATCPAHFIVLDFITLISWEKYKLWFTPNKWLPQLNGDINNWIELYNN
jgi:hypothetical protein